MINMPRYLVVLASVTTLALVLSVIVVLKQGSDTGPQFTPRILFPNLKARLNDAEGILIQTKDGSVRVRRTDAGWVLPDKDNYPALMGEVRRTMIDLSELEIIEPKTADPARHEAIGLEDPLQGGNGILVTLQGSADLVMAGAIVSQAQPGGGMDRFYVRWPTEDQTWLTSGRLDIKKNINGWIDGNVLDVRRGDIAEAEVAPLMGPAYRLVRDDADQSDFVLVAPPEGRKVKPAYSWNTTGFAITGLTVSDVRRADTSGPASNGQITYRFFDGSRLTFVLLQEGDQYWMTISGAAFEPETQPVEAGTVPIAQDITELNEAAQARLGDIKAAMEDWSFGIPQYKFEQMTKPLEELLEPINPGASQ